jgi:hypothetical protein
MKSTRIIIKIFGLISREDISESYFLEITSILDGLNDLIKKRSQKEEPVGKVTRHLKVLLKLISTIIKLKSYKLPKLKVLISDTETAINKKPIEVNILLILASVCRRGSKVRQSH